MHKEIKSLKFDVISKKVIFKHKVKIFKPNKYKKC